MVFKRRKPLSWGRWVAEGFYPKSGWLRAVSYVGHRLRRLPDTPPKIARGIAIGIFVSFTPFFGLHFVVAVFMALLFRGNAISALLGTFFGNPISFPFIATTSLTLGYWVLGADGGPESQKTLFHLFTHATSDFWFNFRALFTERVADWSNLTNFSKGVFLPYMIGGTILGSISGMIGYFVSVPLIMAYQKRRKGRLMARFRERRVKMSKRADEAR